MYLKRMEIRGFKTFADHTEFEFGPGMSGIVGPNGVGKSNITDAILWALGEQSQRAIRTHTAQDVIFSGSEKRSPLGMAEARMVLDNSDGTLPIDFALPPVSKTLNSATSVDHFPPNAGLVFAAATCIPTSASNKIVPYKLDEMSSYVQIVF